VNTLESATSLAQRALVIAAELSLPVLLVGLVVGLFVSVMQAITQVHEQTIAFIPKLLAVGVVIFFLLPWLLTVMTDYTREVLGQMSAVGG